ncbi:MAG: hypothetical protein FJZ01_02520 [Candidatus Sericytochromatia bacterium]|nr:hypothetical protein [Candidatus Tanganyikabacteria bacterium]
MPQGASKISRRAQQNDANNAAIERAAESRRTRQAQRSQGTQQTAASNRARAEQTAQAQAAQKARNNAPPPRDANRGRNVDVFA